jgi:hypothetical protein
MGASDAAREEMQRRHRAVIAAVLVGGVLFLTSSDTLVPVAVHVPVAIVMLAIAAILAAPDPFHARLRTRWDDRFGARHVSPAKVRARPSRPSSRSSRR